MRADVEDFCPELVPSTKVIVVGRPGVPYVIEGAKTVAELKQKIQVMTGASSEHIKIFNPRDGQELPLTSVPLETVALTSTLDGGCGCECMGCKWYGPCFIRELRDDRGEKTGDRMMGLCTLM